MPARAMPAPGEDPVEYKNVTVRDSHNAVVLKDGEGRLKDGLLTVRGSLEPGANLVMDAKYKLSGDQGLKREGRYQGSPGAGTYKFKVD